MYKKYVDYYVSGFSSHGRFMSFYAPTLFVALFFCAHLETWSIFHGSSIVGRSVGISISPLAL